MLKKAITGTLFYCLTYGNIQAAPVELNINIEGSGQLTVASTGEFCTSSCVLTVDNTEAVEMLATTDDSSYVSSWGGSCPAEEEAPWADNVVKLADSEALASKVSIADLNGDGLPDLAMQSMSYAYTRFVVSFNKGDGTFTDSQVVLTIESFLTDIKTADWDQDGDQDVLLVDYDNKVIYLYHNDGVGNFTFNKNIKLSSRPMAIAIADINNDGDLDLLVSSFDTVDMFQGSLGQIVNNIQDSELSWFVNDGDDTFTRHHTVTNREGIYSTNVADYDSDGDLDIVAAGYSGGSFYLFTNENNSYTLKMLDSGIKPYDINFGEINNDNLIDIVAVDRQGYVLSSIQQEDNTFRTLFSILEYTAGAPQGIDVADIDKDGDQDLVIGIFESHGPYYLLENKAVKSCTLNSINKSELNLNVTFSAKTLVADTSDGNTGSELTTDTTGNNADSGGSSNFKWLIFLSIFIVVRTISTKHNVMK